jgi:hypothetical protein
MGGPPVLPDDPDARETFLTALDSAFTACDTIELGPFSEDGSWWSYLRESSFVRDRYLTYTPDRFRTCHVMQLPATFEEYLAQFNAKKRYNLRRQVRILEGSAGNDVVLQRIDAPVHVPALAAAMSLRPNPRNCQSIRALEDLAARGLLRSYILSWGEFTLGCIFGLQYHSVFHMQATTYNKQFARFSPGTVLLYMVVEDLITWRPARMMLR